MSSQKLPISVLILTFNEEANIRDCLDSVWSWADEVFIVDSGSTDKTLKIAREYTDRIYAHAFQTFAQQRNWTQDNLPINNKWVFHLDADERVTPELADELNKIFNTTVNADGFMVPRRTIFQGRWIRYGGHYPVYHLRIFKKDKGRSEERFYDQNYIVRGTVLKINADIVNWLNPDVFAWKDRHRKWALMEAREILYNKDRQMNIKFFGNSIERRNWLRYNVYYRLPVFIRPFLYFFYRYILKLGFLDGRQGLTFHFLHGFWYRFQVDKNIFNLRRKKCIS